MECYSCGMNFRPERLWDAVSSKGIVKICRDCSKKEKLPIVRKPTVSQIRDSENPNFVAKKISLEVPMRKNHDPETEKNLKELVNRNYEASIEHLKKDLKPRPDLEKNFHWVIMRARRRKKLTQGQLAKELAEPENAIKLAEQGILPEEDYVLAKKIENFLDIRIVKDPSWEREVEERRVLPLGENGVKFDSNSVRELKISDLKSMKDQEEMEMLESDSGEEIHDEGNFSREIYRDAEGDTVVIEDHDGGKLSEKEIDDILYGRKKE